MSTPVSDTKAMISGMQPKLWDGEYEFVLWPDDAPWPQGTLASYREEEGLSLIVPLTAASPDALPMRCITLQVHSALDGVGLTAAVSDALAKAGIPANMVAGFHHDHVYVPAGQADEALNVLRQLQGAAK